MAFVFTLTSRLEDLERASSPGAMTVSAHDMRLDANKILGGECIGPVPDHGDRHIKICRQLFTGTDIIKRVHDFQKSLPYLDQRRILVPVRIEIVLGQADRALAEI